MKFGKHEVLKVKLTTVLWSTCLVFSNKARVADAHPSGNTLILLLTSTHILPSVFFFSFPGGFEENISGISLASRAVPAQLRESGGWGNISVPTSPPSTWKDSGATSSPGTGPTHTPAQTGHKVKTERHQSDAASFLFSVANWTFFFCLSVNKMVKCVEYV